MMKRDPRSSLTRLWADLTTTELTDFAVRDPVVVLPLAAVEQHGPHLPLSTDLVICHGILAHALGLLPPDFPALVLPEQAVGVSREHGAYVGTLSMDGATLGKVVGETAGGLARAGLKRLVLFNTHGGNKGALDEAALRVRADHGMLVAKAHSFRMPRPKGVALPEREWEEGLHGGAVETAMMMHLRPDLVRTEHVGAFPSFGAELARELEVVRPEGTAAFAWMAHDLNRHGVVGDARLATAEMGRTLVEGYGAVLAAIVRDARAFPLDRLRPGP
jgi:creatinine amidohydrolase